MKKVFAILLVLMVFVALITTAFADIKINADGTITGSANIGGLNSDESPVIETDLYTIAHRMPELTTTSKVTVYNNKANNPDIISYIIDFNDSSFGLVTSAKPANDTVITIMAVPISVSEDSASDILDFHALFIRAIDSSVESYDAYKLCSETLNEGHAENNGITYLYLEDDNMFVASIPNE